jgi:hypothetical protein
MKRQRPPDRDVTIDSLVRGIKEIARQTRALAERANIGGEVRCTVNVPLRITFCVPSAADGDAIHTWPRPHGSCALLVNAR